MLNYLIYVTHYPYISMQIARMYSIWIYKFLLVCVICAGIQVPMLSVFVVLLFDVQNLIRRTKMFT